MYLRYQGNLYKRIDTSKIAKSIIKTKLLHLNAYSVSIDNQDGQASFSTTHEACRAYEAVKDLLETSSVSINGNVVTFSSENIDLAK